MGIKRAEVILFLACVGLLVANTAQDINIPLWVHSFGVHPAGAYFIILYSSVVFAIFFPVGYLLIRYVLYADKRKNAKYTPPFWENLKDIAAVGIMDALNAFIMIFASDPARTPPVLQPVLGNTSIIFSILLSKYYVNPKRVYLNIWVSSAIFLVAAGVGVMIAPVIVQCICSLGSLNSVAWLFVYILAIVPGAWYNVMQQRCLDRMTAKREEKASANFNEQSSTSSTVGSSDIKYESLPLTISGLSIDMESYYRQLDMWFVLSVSCAVQLVFVCACFWVNFIPWFGYGAEARLLESFQCYFGYFEDCDRTWWLGLIFLGHSILAYFVNIVINETSANYNEIVGALIAPLSVTFWYIFPNLVQAPVDPPPLWSAIVALVLLTVATVIWRVWERKQEEIEKQLNTYESV